MGYSMFVSGVTHKEHEHIFPGFTLFAPTSGDAFYLIDLDGKIIHLWKPPSGAKAAYGRLLENGNLLAGCRWEGNPPAGVGGSLDQVSIEMAWDGNVVWRYDEALLHHDRCRLRNGNTLVVAYEPLPVDFARKLRGGLLIEVDDKQILGERVFEVTKEGEIVWEWHSHEHLNPALEKVLGGGPASWLHCNAIEELPDGRIMLSFNATSTIVIIDRETGAVTWRLTNLTSSQHNPTWLPEGRILVFDNGTARNFSRVIEIEPKTQKVVWEYTGSPRDSFFSSSISGAQRLANGNTLICEGRSGRLFEVRRDGKIVWEYINPYVVEHMGQLSRAVFRAYRYAPDSPQIRFRA